MCVYVYRHVYMYIGLCVYTCLYMFIHICMCLHLSKGVYFEIPWIKAFPLKLHVQTAECICMCDATVCTRSVDASQMPIAIQSVGPLSCVEILDPILLTIRFVRTRKWPL